MISFRGQVRKPLKTQYDGFKVGLLRELLALSNLPTAGKKADLTRRLFQHDIDKEMQAAVKALQRPPATLQSSSDQDSKDGPNATPLRQNHTSYYESLDTAQLVYHLHERDLSVHGDQAELIDRLREFDWDGSESGYSSSDDEDEQDPSASFYHQTIPQQYVDYDGKGLHPSILEGLRVQSFFYDSEQGLRLNCDGCCFNLTFCGWPWPASVGSRVLFYSRIRLDEVLWNGLRSVPNLDERGRDRKSGVESKGNLGSLLIVRTALAVRLTYNKVWHQNFEYRVLGLQFEGMSKMGYVYADDSARPDKVPAWAVNYHDVALEMKKGR